MKKNKVAITLAGLLLLSGCGVENSHHNENEIAQVSEVEVYEKENKVFVTGTHIIKYIEMNKPTFIEGSGYSLYTTSGYDVTDVTAPDGYKLFEVEPLISEYMDNAITTGYIYFFINEVDVEVVGELNKKTGAIEYGNPGKPLENKLTLN